MKLMNMAEASFWRQTFLAAIKRGDNSREAAIVADAAVNKYRERMR